jgi:hypothetical protein
MRENEDKKLLILTHLTKNKAVHFLITLGNILAIFRNICAKTRKRQCNGVNVMGSGLLKGAGGIIF